MISSVPKKLSLLTILSVLIFTPPIIQASEKQLTDQQLADEATQEIFALMQKADAGDLNSQYFLGEFALKLKQPKEAEKWLLMAAKQGDVLSQNLLAHVYLGTEQVKDIEQALYWFNQAAEQNSIHAQAFLGEIYGGAFEEEVPIDYQKSAYWTKKAALNGDDASQHNLANMYRTGEGVLIDYKLAVSWYRKSALQGFGLAQHNLGVMYYHGQGVNRDYNIAYMWLSLGLYNDNNNDTIKMLESVSKKMTQEEINIAQDMAKTCLQSTYKDCG